MEVNARKRQRQNPEQVDLNGPRLQTPTPAGQRSTSFAAAASLTENVQTMKNRLLKKVRDPS